MKTVLCVPGHDEKKVRKCREYGADLILFDLEDSVPEGMKDRAREIVAANITSADAIRFNPPGTEAEALDLDALRHSQVMPHSIWLPKLRIAKPYVNWYRSHVLAAAGQPYRIVIIVETPLLLLNIATIEGNDRALRGVAFGAADFAAYMNVPQSSPQVDYARQQVALVAAALGVPAYDSPCTNVRADSTMLEAERARNLGYQWKGVVHPNQIGITQRVGGRGVEYDRQLVDQYEQQSEAVMLTAGGDLIAPPMIRAAKKRLEDER